MRGPIVLVPVSRYIKKIASRLASDEGYSESPYLNIPYYQERTEPEEDSREVGMGPPSMYEDPDQSDRLKNKEDMRRQGPRPQPSDRLEKDYEYPAMQTGPIGEPRENLQGGPWNDTTTPDGRGDDDSRETWAPDEGDLTNYDENRDVQL